jgi:hypothetical protein
LLAYHCFSEYCSQPPTYTCKADLQMNCSTCRSLHLAGCSFHTLRAPNSAVLIFNFHTWTLFVSAIISCVNILKITFCVERWTGCVAGAAKLACLEGAPQMLAK